MSGQEDATASQCRAHSSQLWVANAFNSRQTANLTTFLVSLTVRVPDGASTNNQFVQSRTGCDEWLSARVAVGGYSSESRAMRPKCGSAFLGILLHGDVAVVTWPQA
jgi:hypothetical protein